MHTMSYYSALREREETLPFHATIRMNLEVILLSEISQPQNNKYYYPTLS